MRLNATVCSATNTQTVEQTSFFNRYARDVVFEVMVINVSVAAMAIMTPSPGIYIELDGRSQVCAMLAQELKLITSI